MVSSENNPERSSPIKLLLSLKYCTDPPINAVNKSKHPSPRVSEVFKPVCLLLIIWLQHLLATALAVAFFCLRVLGAANY